MAQLKKADLIKILVDEYGYEKDDIKLFTNGKLQALIKQEEADAKAMEASENALVATEEKIKDEDLIVVMNGGNGGFIHKSDRTNRRWKFTTFGQTDKMPYAELLAMRNTSPKVFEDCHLVVLNQTVQEQFGLVEKYKNIITPERIEEIFKKDVTELEAFVDALPQGMKVTFVSKARELYEDRKLYDIRVVEMIEKKFGFSLVDNAPLSDIV